MSNFRDDFLWGASTAPHQVEGNNTNSDWWAKEPYMPGMQLSGDAVDSYHRYAEDMQLLADAGANAYRFGIEWARIEPHEGVVSRAALAHYRRMIDTAKQLGLTPVVTLHHFTVPQWFAVDGGWDNARAVDRFVHYVTTVSRILHDVEWIVTINEPNMLGLMRAAEKAMTASADATWQSPTVDGSGHDGPADQAEIFASLEPVGGEVLIAAHHAAREVLRRATSAKVGWSVANMAFTAAPGGENRLAEVNRVWEDVYLEAARGDDFIGVQSYSSQQVSEQGIVPHPRSADNTLTGAAYRPDALGLAVRHTAKVTGGIPIVVTENGIATDDDTRRIEYTREALRGLAAAVDDGIDVRGYLHWSLLDNYEWGHWEPTFGLIAVDRTTFVRFPKPSLEWLGTIARSNGRVLANEITPEPDMAEGRR